MMHTSTLYLIRPMVELAERIAALSGIPDAKVFFTTSGTEANEAALLLASTYRRSRTRCSRCATATTVARSPRSASPATGAGRRRASRRSASTTCTAATGSAVPFRRPRRRRVHRRGVDDLRDVIATTTAGDVACLIAEPIQGVGGFTMPPDGFFGAMKKVLDEYGILFVSDEVQTGWGRTGDHFWGYEAHGVVPDMLTFAKGLGNGLSHGGRRRARRAHGRPAGQLDLDVRRQPARVAPARSPTSRTCSTTTSRPTPRAQGARILRRLAPLAGKLGVVGEVRGRGLMLGIEFVGPDGTLPRTRRPPPACSKRAGPRGLLVGKGGLYGNCLRIAPPLSITSDEADEGSDILADVLAEVDAGLDDGRSLMTQEQTPVIAHWVDGKVWEGTGTRTAPVFDPATGAVAAIVRLASTADVVHGGRLGARPPPPTWRQASLSRRARVLFAFRELVDAAPRRPGRDRSPPSTARCTADALGEVAARHRGRRVRVRHPGHCSRAATASRCRPTSTCTRSASRSAWCAGITPFNFPAMVPMWMFPVAIACGNTFVLKPTERDPGASLLLAELWAEAGLPDGVFSVVHGDKEAVDALLDHPDVDARQLRRLDADRPPRLRDGGARRQAGAGARRRQEPHGRAARRRPRRRGRRGGQRRVRLGGRAVHGDLGGRRGRPDRRRPGRPASPSASRIWSWRRARRPAPTWGRSSPTRTATGRRPTSTRAWPRAPTSSSTGAG